MLGRFWNIEFDYGMFRLLDLAIRFKATVTGGYAGNTYSSFSPNPNAGICPIYLNYSKAPI
jgi:hypothetical protein